MRTRQQTKVPNAQSTVAHLQAKSLHTRPFDASHATADVNAQLTQAKTTGFDPSQVSVFPAAMATVQTKLTIGQVGDKYEQEADNVAKQVVGQINSPQAQSGQPVQREAMPEEEELQMKPMLQREDIPEEEELQMKPMLQREAMPEEEELQMKPMLQRQSTGGMQAEADLESSIQASRGQGQPLDNGLRGSMEQAFGADFSGVRVHTDAQSDQLNQSIQARAFTTGQDVFFRQGAYNPGDRGGQELIAHELTHVVQQNGSAIQQKKDR
ncbi:MAG: eCIS core domain-containing protein [Almyronema sp.]